MLRLESFLFLGTHGPVVRHQPDLQSKITKFFGIRGESEIEDEASGRLLTCQIWIHGGWEKQSELETHLDLLDLNVGRLHGKLKETGTVEQTFKDVTFNGFSQDPIGSHPDLAMGIQAGKVTWFTIGTLTFRQHTVGG